MTTEPQTPAELKAVFRSTLTPAQRIDPAVTGAIDELIEKIELVYCGEYELTPIEFLFGRSLLEVYEQQKGIWND